jgi:hypothetical protein
VLELVAGGRGDGDIGMEGEALQARTARLGFVNDGGRRAQPADRVTGPRTAGEKDEWWFALAQHDMAHDDGPGAVIALEA